VHFIPLYKHPAYKPFFTQRDVRGLKNTEHVYQGALSLPVYPLLLFKEARYIISVIKKLTERYRK